MKRVTGIGGVFFKCEDPKQSLEWYKKHLGLKADDYGATFLWRKEEKPEERAYSLLSMFPAKSNYFGEEKQRFMINFRVENLEELVPVLKAEGVTVLDEIANYDYGKFVHILDGEGNKIELWEANDEEYNKITPDSKNNT